MNKYRILPVGILMAFFGLSSAVTLLSQKDFLKQNLSEKAKLKKITVHVSSDDKKAIKAKWNLSKSPDSLEFYLARDEKGKILSAVAFMEIKVPPENMPSSVGAALKPDGTVQCVQICETQNDYDRSLATKSFLDQFCNKPAAVIKLGKDINAVTGATVSCASVVNAVNAMSAVFSYSVLSKEK